MRRVRICPVCHGIYETSVANCPHDGTDLLLIPPVTLTEEEAAAKAPVATPGEPGTTRVPRATPTHAGLMLELVENPAHRFPVGEGQTVGRTDKSDVVLSSVPNSQYISSRMAKFTRRGDQWFVQHVASTNYIEVDGERYEDDTEVAIFDGSVVSLALCPLIVRIGEP